MDESYLQAGLSLDKPRALAIIRKAGQLDALNAQLDKLSKTEASVSDYNSVRKMFDNLAGSMESLLQLIIFIVVFILSISVGALVYIIYLGRTDEFGILYAMGYRKGFINRYILKELAALTVICWLVGLILSVGMLFLLNILLLDSSGQGIALISTNGVINTLFIPIMVVICAAIPILRKLKKWDPIVVIERKE